MNILRILSTSLVLAILMGSWTVRAEAWSLNPFASSTDSKDTKAAPKAAPKPAAQQAAPATKANASSKGFLGGISNAFKKAPAPKPAPPLTAGVSTSLIKKKDTGKSWGSWFAPEPKKPENLKDFLAMKRPE